MNFLEKKELKLLIIILILISSIIFFKYINKNDFHLIGTSIGDSSKPVENVESSDQKIWVDIDGAIKTPGVYELDSGTRLFQLIEIAGGLTKNAYTKDLNRSILLQEEDKIYIKSIEEIDLEAENKKININTADKSKLMELNGVGESISENIISYREENKFAKIEDIMNVNGIGQSKFDIIKSKIKVN